MHLQGRSERRSILRSTADSKDRRLHRRVPWETRVRGLNDEGTEFEAVTVDVCAGGLGIKTELEFSVGARLVLYIDDIGRVEGIVARRLSNNGYALRLTAPPRKREKIADQLTWLINREALNLEEDRIAERRVATGQMLATYENGVSVACAVADMSIFGVALKTTGPRPIIGEKVTVGGRTGTCVRFIEGGFALDFRAVEGS